MAKARIGAIVLAIETVRGIPRSDPGVAAGRARRADTIAR
jgi:hypothetical protein